ncbi:MAG TPA: hypothetical protein DHW02_09510 [Ktedonobacter sp.]|nr:hypothetical protein [Ktedonobacter sp.]
MMGGMFVMMAWMPFVALFWIVVIVVVVWLVIRWLNHRQPSPLPSEPPRQPQRPPQSYEQGYQSAPAREETYQEGGMVHSYPPASSDYEQAMSYEQPQTQYPQQERPSSR